MNNGWLDWMVFLVENPMNNGWYGWFIVFFSWKILDGMKHFVWIIPTKAMGTDFMTVRKAHTIRWWNGAIRFCWWSLGWGSHLQRCREDDERVIPEPNVVLGLQLSWLVAVLRSKYSSKWTRDPKKSEISDLKIDAKVKSVLKIDDQRGLINFNKMWELLTAWRQSQIYPHVCWQHGWLGTQFLVGKSLSSPKNYWVNR